MKKVLIILLVILGLGGGTYYFYNYFKAKTTKNDSTDTASSEGNSSTPEHVSSLSVILPHISTAEDQRMAIIQKATTLGAYKKVIIISVNHFNTGDNNIQIYPDKWQTQTNDLALDQEIYDNIVSSKIAVSNKEAFSEEHGIKNILPSLSKYFPKAKYISLIIKDTTPRESTEQLAELLYKECSVDCLLASSIDFSHYNPIALANVHDQNTISALESFNYDAIWKAETDSPQSLYIAAKYAELSGSASFELNSHSNTGDINNAHDVETTSYITGIYSHIKSDPKKSTTFIIGGDTMLDRDVWHNYKGDGIEKVFSGLGSRVFRGSDLSIINLEGPISNKPISDDWPQRSLVFNMSPTTIKALQYAKIGAVSLANNHTLNAGASGFATTQNLLKEAGINYVGEQIGFDKTKDILRVDGGIPISVLAIDALTLFDQDVFKQAIIEEKQAGRFVIVMPHWGEEYNNDHNKSQYNFASNWIRAGADLIVGSHPHVIQDIGIIDGKPVIYSLGNLVFDQYFSKATQESLIVAGTVTEEKITLSILPTIQNKSIPSFAKEDNKARIIGDVIDKNLLDNGATKVGFDTIEIKR